MASLDSDSLFPELIPDPPPLPSPSVGPKASSLKPKEEPPCPPSGQLILGANKRNPMLSVYHDEGHDQFLIYHGFEIIEIVPDDPQSAAFKLMLGRFYNCGFKCRSLCETFSIDPKTLRRFGRALKSTPEEMLRILEGRRAARKITTEMGSFARMRWPGIVAYRSYGAAERLRQELQTVFGIKLSRSGLAPLLRELQSPAPVLPQAPAPEGGLPSEEPFEKRESGTQCSATEPTGEPAPVAADKPADSIPPGPAPPPQTVQGSPFFAQDPAPGSYWCEHAGVLLFARLLGAIAKVSAPPQDILAQWLAALWLDAQNIEQTKFLNWEDLELILGPGVRYPTHQRDQLRVLSADPALIHALFGFNQEQLGESVSTDFYFDPHVKHYTGEQNVLKGWGPKLRFADKVLQSDFLHTAQGAPIYFETTDNFADLRERFLGVVARARTALGWPADRVLTQVVDRGIFGDEVFERVAADPYLHLITWEKGFVAGPWEPALVSGKTVITRCRNSSTDLRSYHFEYFARPWAKNPKVCQIVVQATNPQGRIIQVSILTDDGTRALDEIVKLMFRRWLQENDFKYLNQHFGINQITSYRSVDYEKLKGQIEDREVKSGARKALDQSLKEANRDLARELLAEELAAFAHADRQKKSQELTAQWEALPAGDSAERTALQRKRKILARADARYELTRVKRRERITRGHTVLEKVRTDLAATPPTESRLDALIEARMVKLEPQTKRLMDILRITARNGFYHALQPFKKAYDNYRDDHGYFRQLTHSAGVLEVGADEILIHLFPRTQYGGGLRRIVSEVLEQLNAEKLEHPKLPGRRLRFRLAHRSELDLKVRIGH